MIERLEPVRRKAKGLPAEARAQLKVFSGNVVAAQAKLAEAAAALPEEARREIAASVQRLTVAARSPSRFMVAVGDELERLAGAFVPLAARSSLPVRSERSARTSVAVAAGAAAAVSEAEGLLLAATAGAASPGAAVVAGAWFSAFAVEVWVAVSARVHQVRAAGRDVDVAVLEEEVTGALVGTRTGSLGARRLGQRLARRIAARMTRRWAAGLAPGVGIVYDAWDAQRTVRGILALPLDRHPWPPGGSAFDGA